MSRPRRRLLPASLAAFAAVIGLVACFYPRSSAQSPPGKATPAPGQCTFPYKKNGKICLTIPWAYPDTDPDDNAHYKTHIRINSTSTPEWPVKKAVRARRNHNFLVIHAEASDDPGRGKITDPTITIQTYVDGKPQTPVDVTVVEANDEPCS